MRVFREPEEPDYGKDALTFALGAVGGLALGLLLARRGAPERVSQLGAGLRERARSVGDRARTVARRLQPARLRRLEGEQSELATLEDSVLDAFLADGVLSERGIDVGAISPGIIELSGSVYTEDEADRAVRLARTVEGVRTVVNRIEVEEETRRLEQGRRRSAEDVTGVNSLQHTFARTGGMGARRQGHETDPDRPSDAHYQEAEAAYEADVAQFKDEDLSTGKPRMAERPDAQRARRTRFDEDELDNQDPHGKHAPVTLDRQPQELNSLSRVGEGLKPGEELALEQADVPVKPHGKNARDAGSLSQEP